VHELFDEGYRFVTITCCTNADDTFDLFYSFDIDYTLLTLKTTIKSDEVVASVSNIYLAAAFAENEIGELFGVKIKGKAIDYGGHFMLSEGAPNQPFGKGVILVNKEGDNYAG
jgi:NADH:ubiquinone oxidoreductase subunit C